MRKLHYPDLRPPFLYLSLFMLGVTFYACGQEGQVVDFQLLVENQLIRPSQVEIDGESVEVYTVESKTKFTLKDISDAGRKWESRQWIIDGKRSTQNPAIKSMRQLFTGRKQVKLCLLDRAGESVCAVKYLNVNGGLLAEPEEGAFSEIDEPDENSASENPIASNDPPTVPDEATVPTPQAPPKENPIVYQGDDPVKATTTSSVASKPDLNTKPDPEPEIIYTEPRVNKPTATTASPKSMPASPRQEPIVTKPEPRPEPRPKPKATTPPAPAPKVMEPEPEPKPAPPPAPKPTPKPKPQEPRQTEVVAKPRPVATTTVTSSKPRIKVESTPPPPPPAKPKLAAELSRTGTTGGKLTSFKNACGKFDKETGRITITVRKDIELRGFAMNTDGCGKVRITITGNGMNESVTQKLAGGPRAISLSHLGWRLNAGQEYTLTLTPIGDASMCGTIATPGFANATNCGIDERRTAEVSLGYAGDQVIYDFRYYY